MGEEREAAIQAPWQSMLVLAMVIGVVMGIIGHSGGGPGGPGGPGGGGTSR